MQDEASFPHKGWYGRGYLPHCDFPGLVQFITWRLADSLPKQVLERVEQELLHLQELHTKEAEKRRRLEQYLDRGIGHCWLRRKQCAAIVRDCLLFGNGKEYDLHAWVIMSNHVHVLVEFSRGSSMGEIVENWKAVSAVEANIAMNRTGRFWQEDFWDRYIRDHEHYEDTRRYILLNPVRARLVTQYTQWPWVWAAGQK